MVIMMKGLYSGRVIMARKASKGSLTRTQTAAQAHTAIVKKYGSIENAAKYMHKGAGNWVKYSIENDRKRTGKVTTDIKKWRETPHKLDFVGKDTKEAGKKAKITFSVSALKLQKKMTRRNGKSCVVSKRMYKVLKSYPLTIANPKKAYSEAERLLIEYYNTTDPKRSKKLWASANDAFVREFKIVHPVHSLASVSHAFSEFKSDVTMKIRKRKEMKNVLSVAALKVPAKMAGRKTKELPRVEREAITKKVAKKPKKLHNPYNLPVRRISLNIPESNRENIRSRDRLYNSIKANGIIDEIDNKAFLDRLAPKQLQYIIDNYTEYQTPFPENPRFVYTVEEPRFKLSQIGTPKAQLRKRDSKKPITYKGAAITKIISKPAHVKKKTKRVSRDKLSVAERAPEVKKPTGTMPAEFDLKSNPERKEFVSDYTGITDHLNAREKRVNALHEKQRKGTYKNADTRRHEANHAKYMRRKY